MKKVLIVMYNTFNAGGIQKVVMNIVESLSDDYAFDILCFQNDKGNLEDKFLFYGGRIIKVPVYYKGTNRIRKRLDFYIRGLKIHRTVLNTIKKQGPYDIIHCHNSYESGICLKAAKKMRVPIRIAHSHTNFSYKENVIRKVYERVYRYLIYSCATHMVGCSFKANESLYGKYRNKAIVINNGVDMSKFNPNLYPNKTDDNETVRLIHIATFSKNKNQIFTINILDELVKRNIKANLKFIGRYSDQDSEQYYYEMKKQIYEKDLNERIQFLPSNTNVAKALSESDVLIFPSFEEGFPLVPLEAQAMQKKCYISDSVTNELDCGGCTFFSIAKGPIACAEMIINDIKAGNIKGRKYDMHRFEREVIINQYKTLYKDELV